MEDEHTNKLMTFETLLDREMQIWIFFSILLSIISERDTEPCTSPLMKEHVRIAGLAPYSRVKFAPIINKVMLIIRTPPNYEEKWKKYCF